MLEVQFVYGDDVCFDYCCLLIKDEFHVSSWGSTEPPTFNGSGSEENNSFMFGSPQLEVSTTDFAGNLVEGPAILVITVIDQNDNRPIFKETSYRGEVLEGSPTGRWLIHPRTQERCGLLLNLAGKQHHAHYECCSDLRALCCGAVDVVCIRCPEPCGYYVTESDTHS